MTKGNTIVVITLLVIVSVLTGCNTETRNTDTIPSTLSEDANSDAISYGFVKSYPHDITSFTEGLLVHNGKLYESTGSPEELSQTRSLAGIVDLAKGTIEKKVELDRDKYFGEGIVFLHNKLYQLTYQTKIGFIYDASSFKQIGTFTFPSKEGWGLTTDGAFLIMSDGTNTLTYLNPETFKTEKVLTVLDNGGVLANLNELEYIKGFIYANVYTTNFIVKIDPATGKVVGRIDLSALAYDAKAKNPGALEMNGIAFDSTSNSIYVTGKFWPSIYEIKLNK